MKKIILICLFGLAYEAIEAQEIQRTEMLPEVVIKGTGDIDLLLIPCMACRWNEWEEFMERNKDLYRMFAITVPGYGGTPAPQLPTNTDATPWRDYAISGLSALIDQYELDEVVVMGHSWGSMLAVQLASERKDVVTSVISVDGSIESTTWTPESFEQRLDQANQVIIDYADKLQNAEEWSRFNGASVGLALGNTDSITVETMNYRIKLLTSFMATNKEALLQYWRENSLIDLTAHLLNIEIPVLDIQSFTGKDQDQQKQQYLETLSESQAPDNVRSLIMYDTKHFIMYHRPLQLDCIVADFLHGRVLQDYAPEESKYFEEDIMN